MSDSTSLQRRYANLKRSEPFDGYSKVVVNVSDDVVYTAGDDTGRAFEITTPYGSQTVANDLLTKLSRFQYQPVTITGAMLDPSVEIGDAISAGDVYSTVLSKDVTFGSLYKADVSAPGGEAINYEVPYKSKQERTIERNYKDLSSKLTVQAGLISAEVTARESDIDAINAVLSVQSDEISAKVSKTGGSSSSFGWTLLDDSWTVSAGGSTVFKITSSGAEVKGKITATSGQIGGFTINSNYLSYNSMIWGGTNTNGIYIGTSGIQLGKNFKVDSAGKLTAASGTFTGSVYAGSIQYGGDYGTLSGSALTSHSVSGSQIGYNTISTSYTSSGINTSLGYADFSNGVFGGWNMARAVWASSLRIGTNGIQYYPGTISIIDGNNITHSYKVLMTS